MDNLKLIVGIFDLSFDSYLIILILISEMRGIELCQESKILVERELFTRSMPCFTELHSLFYPVGVKVIYSKQLNVIKFSTLNSISPSFFLYKKKVGETIDESMVHYSISK